ncbi:hypothetical protein Tco_0620091 [Tanacetum coccineum]
MAMEPHDEVIRVLGILGIRECIWHESHLRISSLSSRCIVGRQMAFTTIDLAFKYMSSAPWNLLDDIIACSEPTQWSIAFCLHGAPDIAFLLLQLATLYLLLLLMPPSIRTMFPLELEF